MNINDRVRVQGGYRDSAYIAYGHIIGFDANDEDIVLIQLDSGSQGYYRFDMVENPTEENNFTLMNEWW